MLDAKVSAARRNPDAGAEIAAVGDTAAETGYGDDCKHRSDAAIRVSLEGSETFLKIEAAEGRDPAADAGDLIGVIADISSRG